MRLHVIMFCVCHDNFRNLERIQFLKRTFKDFTLTRKFAKIVNTGKAYVYYSDCDLCVANLASFTADSQILVLLVDL